MKTKQELCAAAKLPEATFNTWLGKGLLPEPSGVNKRKVLWEDDVMEQIAFIQARRAAGLGLDDIKAELPGYYLEQMKAAKARAAFLKEWMDEDKAREELADLFGCSLAGADIMLTCEALAWIVSIDGPSVTLAEVDRVNHVIVRYTVVSLEDYIAFRISEICTFADRGIVRIERLNLANRVFTWGEDFKEMVARAKELNSLRAKLHQQ